MRRKANTFTVSFRLLEHDHAKLTERARAFEMSPGEYARTLVRDALTDQHAQQTLHDLGELKRDLQRTLLDLEELKSSLLALEEVKRSLRAQRQYLRSATYCLLVDYGEATEDAAQAFIDEHMAD